MVEADFRATVKGMFERFGDDAVERISSNDPRCAWMFNDYPDDVTTFPKLIEYVLQAPDIRHRAHLERITEYLDWLASLDVVEEIDNLLLTLRLSDSEIGVVLAAKRLPVRNPGKSRHPVSHVLPRDLEEKLSRCRHAWAPASRRLIDAARTICPTTTAAFGEQLALVLDDPGLAIPASFVINLQRWLGIEDGIQVRMMKVTCVEPAGTGASRIEEPTVESPDDSAMLEMPVSQLQDERIQEETSVAIPRRSVPETIESEGVRFQVRQAIERLDLGRGLCARSEVLEYLKGERLHLTNERLTSVLTRIEGYEPIEEDWIGVYVSPRKGQPLVIDQLARKLVSVLGSVSVAVMHAQLARNNAWFKRVPTSVIGTRLAAADWVSIKNHKISTSGLRVLNPRIELDRREYLAWTELGNTSWKGSSDAFSQYISGYATGTRKEIEAMARSSVVFTKINGNVIALRNERDLLEELLAQVTFVDPVHLATSVDTMDSGLPGDVEPQPSKTVHIHGQSKLDARRDPSGVDGSISTKPALEPVTEDEDFSHLDETYDDHEADKEFGSTTTATRTIRDMLGQLREKLIVIPGIQRGYVWKPTQVRDLFDSLYRGYPIGTMLIWETEQRLSVRGVGSAQWNTPEIESRQILLLDGQQRLTSLFFAIVSGEMGVYFNALTRDGAFRTSSAPLKYSVRSIPLCGLLQEDVESILSRCGYHPQKPDYASVREKIDRLIGVLDRVVSVDTLVGFDYAEVTDIFVRVNSRGTKLKAAELAIAGVAYRLPDLVTDELSKYVDDLAKSGWNFTVAFFMRLIAAEGTGRVAYGGLNAMTDESIVASWQKVKIATDLWLAYLRDSLQLIGDEVLVGVNAHIVPITWLARHSYSEVPQRLTYWFVLASVFSRYSGTTDTNLDQDLRRLDSHVADDFVEGLLEPIRARRATLRIEKLDVQRAGQQSALVLIMYLADLNFSRTALFSGQQLFPDQSVDNARISRIQLVSNARLKAVGYGEIDNRLANGGLANVIFVSSSFAQSTARSEVFSRLKSASIEVRFRHALPRIPAQESHSAITQFLEARCEELSKHFNDVLDLIDRNGLNLRSIDDQSRGNRAVSRSGTTFDAIRQRMFETIRARLEDIVPNMQERETGVYYAFSKSHKTRPFASIALRKTMLNFTVTVDVDELDDPLGWCRDVSSVSTHGIGNTSFVITQPDQVDYALRLLEQVVDLTP